MKVKLWLDDIRPAPVGYIWVKDYDESVRALDQIKKRGDEFFVFQMDHDLKIEQYMDQHAQNYTSKNGFHVAQYMVEHQIIPEIVIIHSFNHPGTQNMFNLLSKYTQTVIRKYDVNTQWL